MMTKLRIILLSTLLIFGVSLAKAQSYVSNVNKAADAVKAALANGNVSLAKSKGLELTNTLAAHQRISASKQSIYGRYLMDLMVEARHVSESSSLQYQQAHFNLFMKYWSEAKSKIKN